MKNRTMKQDVNLSNIIFQDFNTVEQNGYSTCLLAVMVGSYVFIYIFRVYFLFLTPGLFYRNR